MTENQRGNAQMSYTNDEKPKMGAPLPPASEENLSGGLLVPAESRTEKPLEGVPPTAPLASNDSNPAPAAAEPHSRDSPVEVSQAATCVKPPEAPVLGSRGSGVIQQESVEERVSSATDTGTVASETSSRTSRSSYKRKKPKKDRSKLRKGKWTPEEEEYTSRIIHYFSSGILTLPEGTTIRGYLADKLNCDPMRITKKYAGAACLGKRVYHFVDRPPATVNQVEMAKADLTQLEQRFRLRVDHGQAGVSIPPRNNLFPDVNSSGMFAPSQMNSFLQNLSATAAAPGAFAPAPAAANVAQTQVGAPAAFPGALLPFFNPNALMPGMVPGMPILPTNGQHPLAALAWAQAAASLSPAISQLAVANLQQQQLDLQKAFEARLKDIAQQSAGNTATSTTTATPTNAPAMSQKVQATPMQAPPSVHTMQPPDIAQTGVAPAPVSPAKPASIPPTVHSPRSKEDEDAGCMLMGFLSSLRKGYEQALSEREQSEGKAPGTLSGHKRQHRIPPSRKTLSDRAETESGTTSYPAESSLEDSDEAGKSNKQTCSSSEGESDKDSSERESSGERGSSSEEGGSVPPRKRMKGKHSVGEFTRQNVAEHNHRMDVMRLGTTQQDPSKLGSRWPRDGRTDGD